MFTLNEMKEIKKGLELLYEEYEETEKHIYNAISIITESDWSKASNDDIEIFTNTAQEKYDVMCLIEKANHYINMINYTIENQ